MQSGLSVLLAGDGRSGKLGLSHFLLSVSAGAGDIVDSLFTKVEWHGHSPTRDLESPSAMWKDDSLAACSRTLVPQKSSMEENFYEQIVFAVALATASVIGPGTGAPSGANR